MNNVNGKLNAHATINKCSSGGGGWGGGWGRGGNIYVSSCTFAGIL